jgi:cold shock CspA family protein
MSNKRQKDDIRYCEKCGISYLWSVEEQKRLEAGARPPECCPGCRQILPSAGRQRGMVKWYSRRKRYGFIVRNGQPELFVPASSLSQPEDLRTGDLVEYSLGSNAVGPIADAVVVVAAVVAPDPTMDEPANRPSRRRASK